MQLTFKRLVDVAAALFLLLIGAPFLALTAVLVWLKIGSPVLFFQQRAGKNGHLFTLYKLRSMLDARDKNGALLNDDKRMPRFGALLRATSLDELPELWNVLKGDMSLIGPRPLLPEYLPYYSETERRRHRMRPGLTGLAQVKGRNALSWDDRLAFDVWYVDHWNLWLDLKIAWSTFAVVLMRRGVHAEGSVTMLRFDDYVRAGRKAPESPDRKKL